MKVSVKVPATTANLGPGFDCMGMALPVYNTITIEETVLPGTGIEINAINDDASADDLLFEHIPLDETSIIYKAVELLYNSIGQTPSELKITDIRELAQEILKNYSEEIDDIVLASTKVRGV